jgi:hypothetical protein
LESRCVTAPVVAPAGAVAPSLPPGADGGSLTVVSPPPTLPGCASWRWLLESGAPLGGAVRREGFPGGRIVRRATSSCVASADWLHSAGHSACDAVGPGSALPTSGQRAAGGSCLRGGAGRLAVCPVPVPTFAGSTTGAIPLEGGSAGDRPRPSASQFAEMAVRDTHEA